MSEQKNQSKLSTRRGLLGLIGVLGLPIIAAIYANAVRDAVDADHNQWIDAIFAGFLLLCIGVLVALSRPSKLAIGLVLLMIVLLCGYLAVVIGLSSDPRDLMKLNPYQAPFTIMMCAMLWYAQRRWDG